jgi:dTDP-4-dehydrorhamnose reductase
MMTIMVLGASGMLGHAVVRVLVERNSPTEIVAVARSMDIRVRFPEARDIGMLSGVDIENPDALVAALERARPTTVINCVGVVKQRDDSDNPLVALPINSIFPHRLWRMCRLVGAKLIHISTDCVFDGERGGYAENDVPNAKDLYGRSKLLGEVIGPGAVTLRTSIIGHELRGAHGLIEWFLAQQSPVRGFRNAVFSGLPTVELAKIIRDCVLGRPNLEGLYHVAAAPISKFDLLSMVSNVYGKKIEIIPYDDYHIDRSLDGSKFSQATGYIAPGWRDLVELMYRYR